MLLSKADKCVEPLYPPTQEVNFHANRPFIYIIREASSGAVFFIGTFR